MRKLLAALDRLALWGAHAACSLIALMLGLILAEVIARKFFRTSLEYAWEYASYLLAISFLAGSGHVLRSGFHVRVQLALSALGPARGRMLDGLASAAATLIAAYFAFSLGRLAWASWVDGTRSFLPSNSPLWPFQTLFAAGAVVLALQCAARVLRLAIGDAPEAVERDAPLIRAE